MFRFFFNDTPTPEIYTLSLHDALPIYSLGVPMVMIDRDESKPFISIIRAAGVPVQIDDVHSAGAPERANIIDAPARFEEHTSELQSPCNLRCPLLADKKKPSVCS